MSKKKKKRERPETRCAICKHLIKANPFTQDIQICKECDDGLGYERIIRLPKK